MIILQDLLSLTEAAETNKDINKAITAIKRELKKEFNSEQVKISVKEEDGKVIAQLAYDRVLDRSEFDNAIKDVERSIKAADESGRWTFKDSGSFFADAAALKPKRGQMMDQGALLCDIEYTITIPNTIRKKS